MLACFAMVLMSMGQAPSRRSAVVTPVRVAPLVDGDLSDWSPGLFAVSPPSSLSAATSFVEEGVIDSDSDHSVEVWLTTTPGFLHLAARVTDDDVVAGATAPEVWRDDGVELILSRPKGALWHLGLNAKGKAWLFAPGGPPPPAIRVAASSRAPGYTLETSIPLSVFGASDASLNGWRINLASRDVDGTAVAHRVWSGFRHTQSASLGQVVVSRADPEPPLVPACPKGSKTIKVEMPLTARGDGLYVKDTQVVLKMVNYQPAARPWARQWLEFDAEQTASDFQRAAALGANAVRLFVFYGPFGEHAVKREMLERLRVVVDAAAAAGLLSVVSFFPFDKEFRPQAYAGMSAHLRQIVSTFVGHPAIAMWDLMNEADHAWSTPDSGVTPRQVSAWAKHMYEVVKEADPTHLVTVGLAGHFATQDAGIDLNQALPFADVVSVHGYFDAVPMGVFLSRAKSLKKPVVLQEFGRSRLLYTADEAAAFDRDVCRHLRAQAVAGFGAWELYDHPVGSIDWYEKPWLEGAENWFGLLRTSGERGLRAKSFCHCMESQQLIIRRWPR